jgi:hypothetical protein
MPTQFLDVQAAGNGGSVATELLFPVYLSLDAEGVGVLDAAGLGARAMLRFLDSAGSGDLTIGMLIGSPFVPVIDGIGDVVIFLDAPVRDAVDVAFAVSGTGAVTVPALRLGLPGLSVGGVGAVAADFIPALPAIREPAWNELRGTVNLVRNPSLENSAVGMTDWGGAGVTVARTTDHAWHGLAAAEAVFASGTADRRLSVRSQAGLGFTGGVPLAVVGAISLLGTLDKIELRLEVTYSDATSAIIAGDLFDLAATGEDWVRVSTPVLETNPAKSVSLFTLYVWRPAVLSAPVTIWADGAQIEIATGGEATPFAAGDMGEHYAWLGAEGLSMSHRETMGAV